MNENCGGGGDCGGEFFCGIQNKSLNLLSLKYEIIMSEFIDYGNSDFESVKNSKFVDKSGLLNVLNSNIDTEDRFMCISRPRRFGKSVAAKMAYAYYDRFSDSRKLFDDLEISKSPDYEKHLNI